MYLFNASDRSVASEGGETGSQLPSLGGFGGWLFLAARMRSWYEVEKEGPMDLPKRCPNSGVGMSTSGRPYRMGDGEWGTPN